MPVTASARWRGLARHRRDAVTLRTQALSKQLGTLAAGVALAGVAAAPVNVFAEDAVAEAPASTTKAAGPAAGRTEFQRQLAALRETKPAAAKPIVREAPAAAPAPTKAAPKAAKAAKTAKKEAPAVADGAPRAADVSFDKPAAQKREGKVIKKAPAKPKSERDADAAKAKEAARVAAREKAAVCDLCGNQISVASRTCSMAWSFHAIDATSHPRAACVRWRGGARRSPYPNSLVDSPQAAAAAQEAKAAAKAAEAAQARAARAAAKAAAPVAAPAPAKGKAAPAPAAKPAKAPAAATPKEKTAAAATQKGKKELGLLLPEEVAREKTLDQIAETREKKKETRALRGMAGNTKNEVKKYKAQEKALDKKLAALAKSKRQQDARVARAKGRAAKAKQRAAKVEKVLIPRPFVYHAIDATSSRRTRRLDGVEGVPPSTRHRVRRRPSATAKPRSRPAKRRRKRARTRSAGRRSLCGNQPPRHRADAVTETTARRRRGAPEI